MTLEGIQIAEVEANDGRETRRIQVYSLIGAWPATLQTRILETLSWKNRNRWEHSSHLDISPDITIHSSRSLCIKNTLDDVAYLSSATELPVQGVQIKGLVYVMHETQGMMMHFDRDDIRLPPKEPWRSPDTLYANVDENGLFLNEKASEGFPSSVSTISRMEKIINNITIAKQRGINVPLLIGYCMFPDSNFEGKAVGIPIFGVYDEYNSRMLDYFSLVPYDHEKCPEHEKYGPHPLMLKKLGWSAEFFKEASEADIEKLLARNKEQIRHISKELFRTYGKFMFDVNKKGLATANPHVENTLPLEDGNVMYDWEISRDTLPYSQIRKAAFGVLDLRGALHQLANWVPFLKQRRYTFLQEMLEEDNPFEITLRAYGVPEQEAITMGAIYKNISLNATPCMDPMEVATQLGEALDTKYQLLVLHFKEIM